MKDTIDWPEIHRRLDDIRLRIVHGFDPTEEEVRTILADRAKALARVSEPAGECQGSLRIIEFLLSGEHYCVGMEYVREILPCGEIVPLPCTPGFVAGITSIRGQILSILDLRQFFNLPPNEASGKNRLIILDDGKMELGILADRICGVRSLPCEVFETDLPALSEISSDYLTGVTADRLIILDAGRFLADRRIIVNEEV